MIGFAPIDTTAAGPGLDWKIVLLAAIIAFAVFQASQKTKAPRKPSR